MPRTARLVLPGIAHHLVQRGNRRQDVFFEEQDYLAYLALLRYLFAEAETRLLAYCLMPNHVHIIATPSDAGGLRCFGEVNKRYTYKINKRMGWKGFLWQSRFSSWPMDERYLYEALRYVELNPVRAKLCGHPADYRWSSARQRLPSGKGTQDLRVCPPPAMVDDWEKYWAEGLEKNDVIETLRKNESRQSFLGIP